MAMTRLSSFTRGQNILHKIIKTCQWYAGIGSGSNPQTSGEKNVINLTKKKCPLIFDVGANTGQYLRMVKSIKPDAEVHCFEPMKESYKILKKQGGAICQCTGLSDTHADKLIYYDKDKLTHASLVKYDICNYTRLVPVTTLDNYCATFQINKIDLLKIDVEGHELSVLKGAKKIMPNIKYIQFEFGESQINARVYFRDFWELLKGRRIYRITKNCLYEIKEYSSRLEQFQTSNYLAVKGN